MQRQIDKKVIQMPWQDSKKGNTDVMWRYTENPIIQRNAIPTTNAGVSRCDNKAVQMNIFAGFSPNGMDWEINQDPIAFKEGNTSMLESAYKYDPRVTYIEDRYWIT